MVFILASKLTMKGLLTLAMAVNHVPAPYSQTGHKDREDYPNMRLYAIGVIMKKAGFTFEARLLQSYVTLLETRCPSLLSSYCQDFNDVLWKATEDESFNFVTMMVSPREMIKFLYDTGS